MPRLTRNATPDDAAHLTRVIDMASDGLLPTLWSEMAPPGMTGAEVGMAMVTAEDGDFSYRNGIVLEEDGTWLGGMIGYPLPATPEPIGSDIPEAFVPVQELANLVPGYWYINVVAVDPENRGRGLGAALMSEAEGRARKQGCPGLALIVAASNEEAIHVYLRAGFNERARRPFDLSVYGAEPTEALLMVKALP